MKIEALKLELINKIKSVRDNDGHKLKQLEATIKEMWPDSEILKRLEKPMRKKTDIEEIKQEQNFKPINKEAFFKKIEQLNIEEPLEKLIEMI